ncbi:MAG TPA: hypothetical protein VJK04_03575 [Candidatus Paceibacterota bacterium]
MKTEAPRASRNETAGPKGDQRFTARDVGGTAAGMGSSPSPTCHHSVGGQAR